MGSEYFYFNEPKKTKEKKAIKKEPIIDEELQKNANDFFIAVKNDLHNIALVCPYCFKYYKYWRGDNLQSLAKKPYIPTGEKEKEKEKFLENLAYDIQRNKNVGDELSLLKNCCCEKCSHFICDNCKSLNKDKPCLFCDNLISQDTLMGFANLEELEEDFKNLIYEFHGKIKNEKLFFRKKLLDEAKKFLTSYDKKVSKLYKDRMEKAKKIKNQNPKKYQSIYDITDKMIENYDKKVEKQEKRKAEEREREIEREIERNDKIRKLKEDKNEWGYRLNSCEKCCKKCYNCGDRDRDSYECKLYAHKRCFQNPDKECFVCRKLFYGKKYNYVKFCDSFECYYEKVENIRKDHTCYICGGLMYLP